MQDAIPSTSTHRKRSIQHRDANSDNENEATSAIHDDQDTSPKRLRNRKGGATHRRVLQYNAQALLSHLAFTRLFVTANFQKYNPASSPIIICIVNRRVEHYDALW